MSEEQKPPDEEEEETVPEEAEPPVDPDKEDPGEDDENEAISPEQLWAEFREIGSRAKAVGLNPLRRAARSYVEPLVEAIGGILDAVEGKRKKGD